MWRYSTYIEVEADTKEEAIARIQDELSDLANSPTVIANDLELASGIEINLN